MSARAHHEAVAGLLGAWVLDACAAEEDRAVQAHLPACAECSAEVDLLRRAVAAIAEGVDRQPPPDLRARVLDAARRRRPGGDTSAVEPFAAEVDKLDQLLRGLPDPQWDTPVVGSWTVCDVVIHLTVTDGLFAQRLGLPVPDAGAGDSGDLVARTEAAIAASAALPPQALRRRWREQADRVCRHLRAADPAGLDRVVDWVGLPLPVGMVVLDRAFEAWIHADDIRAALRRPSAPPTAEHLHDLAAAATRLLPTAAHLIGADSPGHTVRLVLQGPGGGDWLVRMGAGPAGEVRAELVLETIEFCYLVGGRRTPEQVRAAVSGDAASAGDLLRAAAALARP